MSLVTRALPLASIRGIAMDTETTGLDIRLARTIEIAAITLDGEQLGGQHVSTLVACESAIPAASTAIHGLISQDLVGAPSFSEVWTRLADLTRERVWIGYAIGFDVAVLKKACKDASLPWTEPATLDVRLLAQALEPRLPDFSLEALADWLKVPVERRHRALADARIAGEIFLALLPRLRAKGIHTVGDAMGLCWRLSEGSAWPINLPSVSETTPGSEKIDSYPYRHIVRELMSAPPVFASPDMLLHAAVRLMTERRFSSLFVGESNQPASRVGILTERDAMRAIAGGAGALEQPIAAFATPSIITIPDDAFIYRAIGRMSRNRIRHLGVVGYDGCLVGALSMRDLLRLRASAAIELGDDIDEADSVVAMGRAWAKLSAMARALSEDHVPAREIASIIAAEVRAATERAATFAEDEMKAAGLGGAPCRYAVLVLGSAGRGESLLAMDQDNALIFESGGPGGAEDTWFAAFGARMCDVLDRIGIPLCKGGVMVSQPAYRGSVATWRSRIGHWLSRSNPEDLLCVDIVFDLRPACGDALLASELRTAAWTAAKSQKAFLKLLAASGEKAENPFGLFGGWRAGPDGRVDLKNAGLRRLVSGARVLALSGGNVAYSTHDRLAALTEAGAASDIAELDGAHATVLDAILRQQLLDLDAGRAISNRVAPETFDRAQTRRLKAALGHLSVVETLIKDRLAGGV